MNRLVRPLFIKAFFALFASTSLVACQSVSQQIDARNTAAIKLKIECSNILLQQEFEPIRVRARLCEPDWTFVEMLTNNSKMSDDQRALIPALMEQLESFFAKDVEFAKKWDGAAVAGLTAQYQSTLRLKLAHLYNDEITWGQFNQSLLVAYKEFEAEGIRAGQLYWNSMRQDEAARRQAMAAFGAALQNYGNTVYGPAATQQQMLKSGSSASSMYQPSRTTDCQAFGNSVSCTTQGGATLGSDGLYSPPKTTNCQFYGNRMSCTEN